jgi:adenylate kinase family enzyme
LLERGKSSGRSDDNIEVIEKRLLTYEEQTRPVINKFAALGLVRTVDANRSIDEVFSDVSRFFA